MSDFWKKSLPNWRTWSVDVDTSLGHYLRFKSKMMMMMMMMMVHFLKPNAPYYPSQTSVDKGFFQPLHGPLVSFCGSKILVTWFKHFLLLCGFQNIDHVMPNCLLSLYSISFANFLQTAELQKCYHLTRIFLTADWNQQKSPCFTDVWDG